MPLAATSPQQLHRRRWCWRRFGRSSESTPTNLTQGIAWDKLPGRVARMGRGTPVELIACCVRGASDHLRCGASALAIWGERKRNLAQPLSDFSLAGGVRAA